MKNHVQEKTKKLETITKGKFTATFATLEQPKKTVRDTFAGIFTEPEKSVDARPVGIIYSTYDYSLFKKFEGNRDLSKPHIKRLIESIKEMYLVTVAVVSEDFEVFDGAHRIEACKVAGKPVLFVMINGYGLEEIHRYNTATKNWDNSDFVEGYIDLGYDDYKIYKDFLAKYGLGHGSTMGLLEGAAMSSNVNQNQRFKDGDFKVTNLKKATEMAENIIAISKIAENVSKIKLYKNRSFSRACVDMLKNKKYNNATMMSKLSFQSTRLCLCASKEEYLRLLEDIYNYKSRSEKIHFTN